MNIRKTGKVILPLVLCLLCAPLACTSYRAERHYKKGVACQKNDDTVQAIEEFTRTLQYVPEHIDARLAIAAAYESQGLLNKAISAYTEALHYDPTGVEAEYALGAIYSRLHQWDDALKRYGTVVQKDPEHTGAYYALGSIFKMRKENEKAIAAYSKAIAIDENYCAAHYELSLLYFVEGDFKNARKHVEIALKEYPAAQKLIVLIEEETKGLKG
jgi:tetratricopeptide (TPR) repeat protein